MIKFNSLRDVQKTAEELFELHALSDKGWVFKFDNAVRRFGCCRPKKKEISLSKKIVQLNLDYNPEKVHDTILHEIAHALVHINYGPVKHAHGWEWKQTCINIGANPERCYSASEVKTIQGKHKYVCKNCGREVFTHRKKRTQTACGKCCRTYNNNKFSLDYLLEYKGTV